MAPGQWTGSTLRRSRAPGQPTLGRSPVAAHTTATTSVRGHSPKWATSVHSERWYRSPAMAASATSGGQSWKTGGARRTR